MVKSTQYGHKNALPLNSHMLYGPCNYRAHITHITNHGVSFRQSFAKITGLYRHCRAKAPFRALQPVLYGATDVDVPGGTTGLARISMDGNPTNISCLRPIQLKALIQKERDGLIVRPIGPDIHELRIKLVLI